MKTDKLTPKSDASSAGRAAQATDAKDEYWRMCFVIMPYGKREVGGESVNFDAIYKTIFKPAISNVRLQGGIRLAARRDDEQLHSRLPIPALIREVAKARLALADLSGYNPNVISELQWRKLLIPTGTVVVRQPGVAIPFDLGQIIAPEYRYQPPEELKASVKKIAKALRETLRRNEPDSEPYQAARELVGLMGPAERPTELGRKIDEAEEAALKGALGRAAKIYLQATELKPEIGLLHQRRGDLLLSAGRDAEASKAFIKAVDLDLPKVQRESVLKTLDRMGIQYSKEIHKQFKPRFKVDVSELAKNVTTTKPAKDWTRMQQAPGFVFGNRSKIEKVKAADPMKIRFKGDKFGGGRGGSRNPG